MITLSPARWKPENREEESAGEDTEDDGGGGGGGGGLGVPCCSAFVVRR